MSRNTDTTKGCGGKQKFRSFERAALSATRASRSNEEPFHAYKCVRCNRFHVGHTTVLMMKPKPTPKDDADGNDEA